MANFIVGIEWIFSQHVGAGHEHARGAKAALQRVMLTKRCLQRSEIVRTAKTFHRLNAASIGLHREQETRTHAVAVEENCAGAANTVLATDVSARQHEATAQEIR